MSRKISQIKERTTPTQYKYMLLYFNGMSYGRIAQKLGKGKATIWLTIQRGIKNSLNVER